MSTPTTAATGTTTVPDIGTETQVYRIFIRATPERIWDAITKPEFTQQWGYGLRDEYDLRPGGQYRGMASDSMIAMGMSGVVVDGEVIESSPPHTLVITWRMAIDPRMAVEGFTKLTYQIEPGRDGVSKLSVIHDVTGRPGHAAMIAGHNQGPGSNAGWIWILSDLKSMIESGRAMSRA
jgi:uncharacterized protein YndB with AHSA1/START domain